MKKLISLGISIVILISAFVLLPKQKNEDVIAGDAGGKNAKVESLYDLKNTLLSLTGLGDDVKSGTITFKYSHRITSGESSSEGEEYMAAVSEGEYEFFRANDSVTVGTTGSGIGYGSGDTFNDGSLGGVGLGGDVSVENPTVDIPETPGNGTITVNPEFGEQYDNEYEDQVNDNINDALQNMTIGLTADSVDLTVYFDEDVVYYQVKGTHASRQGDGNDKEVLTYVYDLELYLTENGNGKRLVRFNFFDGYSNDSDISPVITADKLGIWYDMDDEAIFYVNMLFGDYGYLFNEIWSTDESMFDQNGDEYLISGNGYEFRIDLSNEEKPSFSYHVNSSDNDYVNGHTLDFESDSKYVLSNLGNTKVEFDLSKVDVHKASDFDWDFFADLFGFKYGEGGIY